MHTERHQGDTRLRFKTVSPAGGEFGTIMTATLIRAKRAVWCEAVLLPYTPEEVWRERTT